MSKKTREILFKHARRRAGERYDLELTWQLFEQFNGLLRGSQPSNRVLFLAKESCALTHYLIDDKYIVVFDKIRKAIKTFLPADAINNYLKGSTYIQDRREWKA